MASERRAQVVRLAAILGIEFERSIGTAELMEMCVVECDGRAANWGQEPDESERDDQPPAGMREALRSVAPEPAQTSSGPKHRAGGSGARKLKKAAERFESERAQRFEGEVGDASEDSPEDATDEGGIEPAIRFTRREKRRGRAA